MKTSVTITQVTSLSKGPWIYWADLEVSIPKAKAVGFDAVELFPPRAEAIEVVKLEHLLRQEGLRVSAIGSGAGKVLQGLTLVNPDGAVRVKARAFIAGLIEVAARFGTPVIIGSMQGSLEKGVSRPQALGWLREGLQELGEKAKKGGAKLLFEPLNRYETDMINRLEQGVELVRSLGNGNVALLADLFHMNIEEDSLPAALRAAKGHIGYVHIADSNRHPIGMGHIVLGEVFQALRDIGYDGYLSVEALPYPDPDRAAAQTIATCRAHGIGQA
jgi:sugar phosphate isomerase/epimerase